jgi:hypothetical protein
MDDNTPQLPQTDHDLLIELRVELKGMRQDVNKASDDTRERLLLLGTNKVEKDAFATYLQSDAVFKKDHETRMRRLELWGALAIGALWIAQLIIGWYLIVHFNNR